MATFGVSSNGDISPVRIVVRKKVAGAMHNYRVPVLGIYVIITEESSQDLGDQLDGQMGH